MKGFFVLICYFEFVCSGINFDVVINLSGDFSKVLNIDSGYFDGKFVNKSLFMFFFISRICSLNMDIFYRIISVNDKLVWIFLELNVVSLNVVRYLVLRFFWLLFFILIFGFKVYILMVDRKNLLNFF